MKKLSRVGVVAVLFGLLPEVVLAKEDVYVGFGSAYSIDEAKDIASEYLGTELYYGYQSTKYFAMEFGVADYALYRSVEGGQDLLSVFGRFRAEYALNSGTDLYFGTGFSYTANNVRPLLNIGINHRISNGVSLDFGYQGLFGTNDIHMDVYGLKVAMNYHF